MKPEQIQDALNIGFFTLKPDYTVSSWNKWLELNTEVKQAEILNKNIFQYFSYLDNPSFTRKVESVLKFGNFAHFSQKLHKYLLRVKAGASGRGIFDSMQQTCTMGPIRDKEGIISEVFVTINDVTDIAIMEVELRRSKTLLSSIIDDQTELVCRFSPDGIITFANDSFCRYFSRARADILGTSAFIFIYKGDWRLMIKLLKSLNSSNPVSNIEFRVTMPDTGEMRWQNWTGKAFFSSNGEMTECQAVGRDITQQKEADEEIKKSKEELEKKVEERTKALKQKDKENTMLLSDYFERIKELNCLYSISSLIDTPGYGREDVFSGTVNIITSSWQYPEIARARIIFEGTVYESDDFCRSQWVQASAIIVNETEVGKVEVYYIEEIPDLFEGPFFKEEKDLINAIAEMLGKFSEQIAAEQALQESERKYRQLFGLAQEGIWVINADSITTMVNPSMAKMLGYSEDEMLGRHLFSFMDDKGIELCKQNLERRQLGIKEQHDFEFIKKNGVRIYVTLGTTPIIGDDGEYAGAIAGVIDLTERKKSEFALKESEALYRGLFNASRDGLVIEDNKGLISDVNPAFCKITGFSRSELIDMPYRNLIPDKWSGMQEDIVKNEVLVQGYSRVYELEHKDRDKGIFPASVRSYSRPDDHGTVMHNVRDITMRKASEAERTRILKEMEYKVKHFRCLYIVTASIQMSENLQEMCKEIIHILKISMQYPENLCVRICINGVNYESPDYKCTPWSLKSEMVIEGTGNPSFLELNYLQEPPEVERQIIPDNIIALDPYPFTMGEAELVDIVSFLICEDIEHRRATDALYAYHEKLKALSCELENVEANERTKIAGELHDQIGQKLAFLKIHVGRLKKGVSEEGSPTLESAASLLDDIIKDSRTIMLEISPAALFELGFTESITWLADQFKDSHGLNVSVVSSLKNGNLPKDWYMPLFKVVRESLNNVVKHAEASEVTVSLSLNDDRINLMVEDDGRGFDPGEMTSFGRHKFSLGLFNIKQTLDYLGGAMEIESEPGKGTTVRASLSCKKEEKNEH